MCTREGKEMKEQRTKWRRWKGREECGKNIQIIHTVCVNVEI
jgi:hypothetical protein